MPEFRSRLHEAFEGTKSLRTTVPREVAAMLGLGSGDEIAWVVEPGSLEGRVSKAASLRNAGTSEPPSNPAGSSKKSKRA
jgi:hypothetical protein